ncbi:hypothetical protein CGG80_05740 [Vibrio parahaemolyticus]|uniref:gamma-mobile-trio protein GmtX n=1 Tax=Vibrio parahaemolyticus TaxID=670 RepID=UPI001121E271|nr:gamma-mobile-trio protein GmtX [Vibrio parahaemolyticus]TOQ03400.1 hypothetical protein CGH03_21630 [Vibrio parahaemolyticus]TOR18771.1 hypothetical protein CGG80_05740 [Vibrio parahaemolyticus]HCG7748526.1 hypothetical protein [Vibrio parahaemolyticus]
MSKNKINMVFEALHEQAKSATAKRNLKIINEACLDELQIGTKNFSYANIGRLSGEKGGVKTQTIRNKTGKLYRDLIDSYASSHKSTITPKERGQFDWVESIEQPDIRVLVAELIRDRKKLKSECDQLRRRIIEDGVCINLDDTGVAPSEPPQEDILSAMPQYQKDAIIQSIDPKRLRREGLIKGQLDDIIDADGVQVMPEGFVEAMTTLIDVLKK